MPVYDLWKGQNCQVADKCIFTIYIYNKYFANKLTTLPLHQKSFVYSNIFNKIKCMYWFNYKIVIGSQRKTSKCKLNFNLNQTNSWCKNYNQYIQKNQIRHKSNKLCILQTGIKATTSVETINAMGDKSAMSIGWRKLNYL